MDAALAFDVPDHLGDNVFGRDGDHHVHVIGQEMPALDPALLLLRQGAECLAEMRMQRLVECLPTLLRNKEYVMFARPLGVA